MTSQFVSRAGGKLAHALKEFDIDVQGKTCADFGSSTGGFVDVLLQNGARKVYAVETGYGVLDWKLRNDDRVEVMERTNALHVELPEKVDLVTVDTSWTRQEKIVPAAAGQLKPGGQIIALLKPHYEAERRDLVKGVLPSERVSIKVEEVINKLAKLGFKVLQKTESPIKGEKGGNTEYLLLIDNH